MSEIKIRKAERRRSKLRLGLAGPSGSGKTFSSLKLARGIGGKVCMIDTERGSGDLYAHLFDYDIITLQPPYKPENYVQAIAAAEDAGYDVIIIDSLSHAWQDEGGLLDQADKMQGAGKNRFTVWADLTPQHRQLVNAMLNSPAHIIGTMRSKQSHEIEKDEKTGKSTVKKVGMAPVQRDGMEYEFTVFMDIDQNHHAQASKDRTGMFSNEIFQIDEGVGQRISKWLNEGKSNPEISKLEIKRQLKRLGVSLPTVETDRREFLAQAMPKLIGVEWKEENLEKIVEGLQALDSSVNANEIAWSSETRSNTTNQSSEKEHGDDNRQDPPEGGQTNQTPAGDQGNGGTAKGGARTPQNRA